MNDRHGPIPDSYWVVPGRVLAGEYPGAEFDDDARMKLGEFLQAGIDFFVDLTERGEYSLRPYDGLAAELGEFEHRRRSIRDGDCPTVDEMRAVLDEIDEALGRGKNVYVHCFGGIGRTGTVVGCYLVRHGMTPADALRAIARWREGTPDGYARSPENDDQVNFVLAWNESSTG